MINNEDWAPQKSLDEAGCEVNQNHLIRFKEGIIEDLEKENFELKKEIEKVELRVLRNFEKMALEFQGEIKQLKETNTSLIERYGLNTN